MTSVSRPASRPSQAGRRAYHHVSRLRGGRAMRRLGLVGMLLKRHRVTVAQQEWNAELIGGERITRPWIAADQCHCRLPASDEGHATSVWDSTMTSDHSELTEWCAVS